MAEVRLDNQTLLHIGLFEKITRVRIRDCVEMDDKIIFMVDNGWITKAVGKNGENVSKLRKALDKTIQIIEHSDDPQQFVRSVFHPYGVESVELETRGNQIHATVKVNPVLKAKAIGKQGRNLKIFRDIISRHHDIQSVSVS
ncbi:MAG: NusA-like transcription termination signal-binding factor [Candidatus Thermoplasmatota archaeon]|nr:NusA-like transcription termination signal-binding factor [Euryarchaeota archaeon]MBU4031169.1 NusA-like transcription termination signal-binding factor [Candidatus Thermoplasmatota archaeon]MBU4144666.1 NusA-like transcription termination signal-binding factor [Candidatus Thermoplasmatota archaeon]MBU4592519.1 NusA-like transcription termination signal-binding factor [Candidatus Thermoplasmatota archaeon]